MTDIHQQRIAIKNRVRELKDEMKTLGPEDALRMRDILKEISFATQALLDAEKAEARP